MATLRDLAQAADVSIRTVNRVLKNDGYVGAATRRKVEAAVRRLGYRPNLAARALKTARSHIVSALAFTEDELRMAQIAGCEQRLRDAHYLLSLTFHFETGGRGQALRLVREIVAQNPAGIVVFGHDFEVLRRLLPALMREIVRSRLPYILIDPRGTRYDQVAIDRPRGVCDAVRYLAARGRRRIAFLGPLDERSRLDGYEQALRELGRPPLCLPFPGLGLEELRRAGRNFARQKGRPDAVVAHADYIALPFLAGLHDAGVRVPEEVALVGFDDRAAARMASPPLTTIAQPGRDIGRLGAEILLRKIAGEKTPPGGWSQSVPAPLVIRETA